MTRDFKRKWTEEDEQAIDGAFITGLKYVAVLLMFVFAVSTFAKAQAEPVKEYRMTSVKLSKLDRKLAIGPELKSYRKRVSHTRITDLGEVE